MRHSVFLALLFCLSLLGSSESFAAQSVFKWAVPYLWNKRSHDRLSRSAVYSLLQKHIATKLHANFFEKYVTQIWPIHAF
jgi:hypothetical protein